jgi:hypothetical protein
MSSMESVHAARVDAPRPAIARLATRLTFWSAVLTAVFAAVSFALAVTTPPRSGPFAGVGRIVYPYTSGSAFVPRDYLWMYPAMLTMVAFIVLVACVHDSAAGRGRVFGIVGLCFAAISSTIVITNYFIQLHVLQPMLLRGETEGLSVWSQYNPHGVFIALEELGYLALSVAFLFLALSLDARGGSESTIRRVFLVSSFLGFALLVGLSVAYGFDLEYRFECAIIVINWVTLIVGGALLAIVARSPRAGYAR